MGELSIPRPLVVFHALLTGAVVTSYTIRYGPLHLLWLSDVALILMLPALWLRSPLLASMAAVAVLPLELAWNGFFLYGLLVGPPPTGMADYMFDPATPLDVRVLSGLFHVYLPVVLIFALRRLGYDRRALLAQTALTWAVLLAAYLLTPPERNVDFVHRVGDGPLLPQPGHLLLLMAAAPLLAHLPTHLVLRRLFSR